MIAPHRFRPSFDLGFGYGLADRVVIVVDFQGPEIFGAEVERLASIDFPAETTLETSNKFTGHGMTLPEDSQNSCSANSLLAGGATSHRRRGHCADRSPSG